MWKDIETAEDLLGYRFYAKYVQRQKLWFVQSLSYPASCTRAVSRLIDQIDDWQVWEEKE